MAASAPVSFVGRARETAELERLLGRAMAGTAGGVLVAGDAGVGKTRLTRQFLGTAKRLGAVPVLGHCIDLGAGGLPYLPFAEALTQLTRDGAANGGSQAARDAADTVRAMTASHPVLQQLTGRGGVSDGRDGPERLLLYEAVLGALRAIADDVAPLVLAIEDLHWADPSTCDLVRFVLARLCDERLLVVGTYRTDDLHRRHPVRPLLAELVRLPHVDRVDVTPFDADELAEYLRRLKGSDVPAPLLENIRARSEGNAFYAEELMAAAEDAPSVPAAPAAAMIASRRRGPDLPEQIADVLLARVDRLSPAAQKVARFASVAGRRVDDVLLRRAVDLPAADADNALREAVAHHVLVDDGTERFTFRHALLQEAVYGDLLPGERARIHAVYAGLLTERGDEVAGDLARHCLAANDLAGALAASIRAANRSIPLAPAEALHHYEQALNLFEAVPPADRPPGTTISDLARLASDAAAATGDPHRAVALAREAVAAAVAAGSEPVVEADVRITLVHRLFEHDAMDEVLRETAAIRTLLEGKDPTAAGVWAAAVEARIAHKSSLEESRAFIEPVLAQARELGLRDAQAELYLTLARQEGVAGAVDDATRHTADGHRLAVEVDHNVLPIVAVYQLGLNRLDVGDLVGALADFERGLALADRVGLALSVYGFDCLFMRLQCLVLSGEWDAALAIEARLRGPAVQRQQIGTALLAVRVARDPVAALQVAEELLPLARSDPRWFGHRVLVPWADALCWMGDHEGAIGEIRECLRLKDANGHRLDPSKLVVLATGLGILADAAADATLREHTGALTALRAEGDDLLGHARDVARRCRPQLGSLGPEGRAWLARAEAEHARLHGSHAPDDWRRVVEAFGFGQRYEVARSRRHLAEALAAAGDREAAGAEALLARDEAVALGARPLREAVDALARRARLDLGAGPAAVSVLTPREQEVMRLVAQGLTNRQIGRQLFISEKTASVHVSNVLAKLGAGGRTEAVAIAHRRGLLADQPSG